MPNPKKRARRRQGGASMFLSGLIVLLSLLAVLLIMLLVHSDPFSAPGKEEALPYSYTATIDFGTAESPGAPMQTLGISSITAGAVADAAATPAPGATGGSGNGGPSVPAGANAAQSAAETGSGSDAAPATADGSSGASGQAGDAVRLAPTPMPGDYFLPVYDRALRTPDDPAMIAITIDNCDDRKLMNQILQLARQYGARLTLFPTGDALMKFPKVFRTCFQQGHELEGHCYNAGKPDYSLSDGELALQIWRQGIATSYVLQGDYQQHFYRPQTRQSAVDQRTHFFLRKLGMLGVASYSYSYLYHDLEDLVETLENGNIYQFDLSDESMALLEGFMAEANRRGYRMVSMNELFGLEDNVRSRDLTIDRQVLPDLSDYVPSYYTLRLYDRAYAVYGLQARLIELGYIVEQPGEHLSDGIYGSATSEAVSTFQAKVGLVATGDADVETQQRLFAEDAPGA